VLAPFTLEPGDWSPYLEQLVATFVPARSRVLWESPDVWNESRPRLYDDFKELVASARAEVLISSPYFIPDAEFRALLRELVAKGVRVVVVTNSLATNNHVVAHTGYRRWRREVLAAVDAAPGERVLDLAAGTGTSSEPFAAAGAVVVPCDFSLGMLEVGKKARPELPFTAGDATRLPFADDSFDAVTISFGLRNIVDPVAGLREMLRVTRPGGRLVVCEFSHPTYAPLRTVYLEYLMKALPTIARAVSSSPDAYVYLAESIRAWPDQPGLAAMLAEAGWESPEWRNLSGGIVALHRAIA
jgi:demethylmenaquinone methyltransferase/2-methoxy-6-polyprenyl-1,4-benzoquinol methylase